MTRPQDKGREAENHAVKFLAVNGWPYMERKRLRGSKDQGDLTGAPGLMFEVKYLGRNVSTRMAAWIKQVDVQTVNAGADYGILIVKPPGVGERNAGKFWAIMRWSQWLRLRDQAGRPPLYADNRTFSHAHSNARLTTLGAKIIELDRIPGHEWVVSIPPRVPETMGLAVMTLERIVPLLHAAGYGGNGVSTGTSNGSVSGAEAGRAEATF